MCLARVDHLVYAGPDLDDVVARLEGLFGTRPSPGGRHARWGTHNAILAVGPRCYIEAIAPDPQRADGPGDRGASHSDTERGRGRGAHPDHRADPAAGAPLPAIFGLDTLTEPRLVGWAATTTDFAERSVLDTGEVLEGRRERPDGSTLTWRMTDPLRVTAFSPLPFLIDWGDSPHPAAAAPRVGTLIDLRATHPEAPTLAPLLAGVGLPIVIDPGRPARITASFETATGPVELW